MKPLSQCSTLTPFDMAMTMRPWAGVPRLLHRDLPRSARRGVVGNGTCPATGGGGRGAGARVRLHRLARPRHPAHGGDRELRRA